MIFVRLRGVFGIFAFAMERIFSDGRSQQSPFAVNDGNTNAQCPEIYASNDGHEVSPLESLALVHFAAMDRCAYVLRPGANLTQ